MNENIITIIVLAGFIILQRWVLPKFGIHTCMSPNSSCGINKKQRDEEDKSSVIEI